MNGHNYFVYIVKNAKKTVLYVGVTNDLAWRLYEHFTNRGESKTFAGQYFCYTLIFYERHSDVNHTIEREKEIKKWRREKKDHSIISSNPQGRFLNAEVRG